jgi:hypothetical protein
MKKSFLAGMLISGLLGGAAFAADTQKITGVLIDAKCGKDKDEAGAAGHPKACTLKCAKGGELTLVSGKDILKLDADSKAKAVAFLEKAASTKVTVEGTKKDDTLTITSIEAAKAEK